MVRQFELRRLFVAVSVVFAAWSISGHPIPDIPVRSFFDRSSNARIEVEVDPRFFAEDPMTAPYLFKKDFDAMPESERTVLLEKAKNYAAQAVSFHFQPLGPFLPDLEYRFTGLANGILENEDDPVMMTGSWTTKIPSGLTGYRVEALWSGEFSVLVLNSINGHQLKRIHVLFPGETSYLLDLGGLTADEATITAPDDESTPAD